MPLSSRSGQRPILSQGEYAPPQVRVTGVGYLRFYRVGGTIAAITMCLTQATGNGQQAARHSHETTAGNDFHAIAAPIAQNRDDFA